MFAGVFPPVVSGGCKGTKRGGGGSYMNGMLMGVWSLSIFKGMLVKLWEVIFLWTFEKTLLERVSLGCIVLHLKGVPKRRWKEERSLSLRRGFVVPLEGMLLCVSRGVSLLSLTY